MCFWMKIPSPAMIRRCGTDSETVELRTGVVGVIMTVPGLLGEIYYPYHVVGTVLIPIPRRPEGSILKEGVQGGGLISTSVGKAVTLISQVDDIVAILHHPIGGLGALMRSMSALRKTGGDITGAAPQTGQMRNPQAIVQ